MTGGGRGLRDQEPGGAGLLRICAGAGRQRARDPCGRRQRSEALLCAAAASCGIERLDRTKPFQATITATADLAGVVTGLSDLRGPRGVGGAGRLHRGPVHGGGRQRQCRPAIHRCGAGGAVARAGVWESMPRWFITRQRRDREAAGPRAYSARACDRHNPRSPSAANGSAPQDMPLLTTNSPVDTAPAPFSGEVVRRGILGSMTAPRWW